MGDYQERAQPGFRLPHVWLDDGRSVLDVLGPGFTLLRTDPGVGVTPWTSAARELGIPLTVVDLPGPLTVIRRAAARAPGPARRLDGRRGRPPRASSCTQSPGASPPASGRDHQEKTPCHTHWASTSGGTFTDAVASDGAGRIVSAKTPTTPPNREAGVMRAIEDLAGELGIGVGELLSQTDYIAHGTTASINALVQGRWPTSG